MSKKEELIASIKAHGKAWIRQQIGFMKHFHGGNVLYALALKTALNELEPEQLTIKFGGEHEKKISHNALRH